MHSVFALSLGTTMCLCFIYVCLCLSVSFINNVYSFFPNAMSGIHAWALALRKKGAVEFIETLCGCIQSAGKKFHITQKVNFFRVVGGETGVNNTIEQWDFLWR